jgi:chromosome segregation ATPase
MSARDLLSQEIGEDATLREEIARLRSELDLYRASLAPLQERIEGLERERDSAQDLVNQLGLRITKALNAIVRESDPSSGRPWLVSHVWSLLDPTSEPPSESPS